MNRGKNKCTAHTTHAYIQFDLMHVSWWKKEYEVHALDASNLTRTVANYKSTRLPSTSELFLAKMPAPQHETVKPEWPI